MNLPTIEEVEHSVGGRPKMINPKVRLSFYFSPDEEQSMRMLAEKESTSISSIMRIVVMKYIDDLA